MFNILNSKVPECSSPTIVSFDVLSNFYAHFLHVPDNIMSRGELRQLNHFSHFGLLFTNHLLNLNENFMKIHS